MPHYETESLRICVLIVAWTCTGLPGGVTRWRASTATSGDRGGSSWPGSRASVLRRWLSGNTGRGIWWCIARRRAAGRPGTHRGTSGAGNGIGAPDADGLLRPVAGSVRAAGDWPCGVPCLCPSGLPGARGNLHPPDGVTGSRPGRPPGSSRAGSLGSPSRRRPCRSGEAARAIFGATEHGVGRACLLVAPPPPG